MTDDRIFELENSLPDDAMSDRQWTLALARAVEREVVQEWVWAMNANHWTIFNSAGAVVADNVSLDVARAYMTAERFERGWNAVYCVNVTSSEGLEEVSTARGYSPEKEGAGRLPFPADGDLRTAIEEALASLECGMVEGAAYTLREALSRIPHSVAVEGVPEEVPASDQTEPPDAHGPEPLAELNGQ